MTYKIISILLTVIGSAGLVSALFPTRHICKIDEQYCLRWKALGTFILFFVIGYLRFIYMVFLGNGSLLQLEVALILCGGGIFVPLVIKMSVLSMNRIRKMSERILYRAGHDDLTDLPNRFALKEYLNKAILEATQESRPVSLLLLDIDRFKEINDALGHQHGDYLLQLTASRLNKCTRGADIISRLGGDEFAVVLPGANIEQAIAVSEKISREMEEPFSIENYNVNIDLSIGISFFPEHGDDSEALLQRADVAMYTAKRSNTKFAVYDAEQDKYTMARLKLTEDLREAIKENHLVLHYQPKISAKDAKLCGVEALVRWNHTHQNLLYPDQFIGLAEQTGLIRSLTLWVVDNSLRQKAAWQEEGFDIPMAINISIKNLQDLDFPYQVKELLTKWQVDPSTVTFEITESSMMLDPDRTFEVISNLHSMGLNISIDDFGTGYSSLAYLKQLPAAEIKIDKSFVMDMLEDDNDAIIVRSTIDLANNMGLRIVAEGVENIQMFDFLIELGCEIMQGHHFCPAVPPDELLSKVNIVLPEMAAA
jgi:diguanylate cyclase (GGDEF)-like protein